MLCNIFQKTAIFYNCFLCLCCLFSLSCLGLSYCFFNSCLSSFCSSFCCFLGSFCLHLSLSFSGFRCCFCSGTYDCYFGIILTCFLRSLAFFYSFSFFSRFAFCHFLLSFGRTLICLGSFYRLCFYAFSLSFCSLGIHSFCLCFLGIAQELLEQACLGSYGYFRIFIAINRELEGHSFCRLVLIHEGDELTSG